MIATSLAEARAALADIGLPLIVRPGVHARRLRRRDRATEEEFERIVGAGLAASPIGQVLIDESVLGWGEFELEVMRDRNDNVVIVCSIENLDPMGVHTGDSVCVAPQQTLTDQQYQALRDQAIAVIRAVGVETGGSNVQFAVNPATDEIVVIEMNPRVSRSSALASKATGFPIAKIAARLAVGYALEEIPNDITRARRPASSRRSTTWSSSGRASRSRSSRASTPSSTTHMKSVGEAMAIGRTFQQAFAKAMRSRELDVRGPDRFAGATSRRAAAPWRPTASTSCSRRCAAGAASRRCTSAPASTPGSCASCASSRSTPRPPFAGSARFRSVDTCAAEFAAETPYYYSAWERRAAPREVRRGDRPSVVILGAGPNRIGQGIEFDYCCVHAAMTVRESGRDAVMVNCNPETVSTDYDTSDRLYFEPLTLEDVLGVIEVEQPEGRDRPVRRPDAAEARGRAGGGGRPALGHATRRDRPRRGPRALRRAARPTWATRRRPTPRRTRPTEALTAAPGVGFPLLVRPSYVLGGRAMEIVYDADGLADYLERTGATRSNGGGKEIYLDRFLENAIEVDVDALCDGERRLDRRDHAARRGGRDPLRRLGLRAAAALARARRCSSASASTRAGSRSASAWSA